MYNENIKIKVKKISLEIMLENGREFRTNGPATEMPVLQTW